MEKMIEQNKKEKFVVPVENLRYVCDEKFIKDTIKPTKRFIGQEKAIEALKFGLEVDSSGYNIFVVGFPGTGKTTVIYDYISQVAEERKNRGEVRLRDFCFVYNFNNPDRPICLVFDAGEGKKFQDIVLKIFKRLENELNLENNEEYLRSKEKLINKYQLVMNKELKVIKDRLKKDSFDLFEDINTNSFLAVPLSKSYPKALMKMSEYNKLSKKEKEKIKEKQKQLDELIAKSKIHLKIDLLRQLLREDLQNFEIEFVNQILDNVFNIIIDKYRDNEKAVQFLKNLKDFSFKERKKFIKQNKQSIDVLSGLMLLPTNNNVDIFLPFNVNVIVDNSGKDKPPVIIEHYPTLANMFGRVDKKIINGVYATNHTFITAGSLCQADGGYWVVDINEIFRNAPITAWFKLEKTLKEGFLKIEDAAEYLGLNYGSLNPDKIPLNVKVIVIGDPYIYYILTKVDNQFLSIFKVKAEFDSKMPLNKNNVEDYAAFIESMIQKYNLLPFDSSGIAKIVEYGARLSSSQKKLSTCFGDIKNIIIEADYWAKKSGSEIVTSEHVKKAITAKKERVDLVQEKMLESFKDGIYLIDVNGFKVGQINGLVVYSLGDCEFGLPVRITAKTFLGGGNIISIQKESKMAGPIHNTGLLTLSGYFNSKYGLNKKLNFSAIITFEQCYSQIEGDSASMAELVCLISALSDIPINPGIAITGSVNQNGEAQPIGGINEKIEGFYSFCKAKGLTGSQGVIIPKANLNNLVLDEEIVEAVKNKKFFIYAIKSVDEAVEILLEKDSAEIHKLVDRKLEEMNRMGIGKGKDKEIKV